jgi:putative ABC transport system ATP-binding protein
LPALELQDVRKVYPSGEGEVVALDHAVLTVETGELVALVGPSGSGKSTLLSIAGVLVTHDTRMVHHCDRTVEIVDGRLAA